MEKLLEVHKYSPLNLFCINCQPLLTNFLFCEIFLHVSLHIHYPLPAHLFLLLGLYHQSHGSAREFMSLLCDWHYLENQCLDPENFQSEYDIFSQIMTSVHTLLQFLDNLKFLLIYPKSLFDL